MLRPLVAISGLLSLLLTACQTAPGVPIELLAFTNVNVVAIETPGVMRDQTVLVRGERITALGPAATIDIPANATVVDGHGRYLMPGLADMHAHLPRGREDWSPSINRYFDLTLAAGVTTIRSMRGASGDVALRDAIAAGEREGPRLIAGSPGINAQTAPNPETARTLATQYAEAGYDFLKVLGGFDRATFDAIVEQAHKLGLPLAGHVPKGVPLDAVLADYWSVEHMQGHGVAMNTSPESFAELAARTAEAAIWVCPTLAFQVSWYGQSPLQEMLDWPGVQHVDPAEVADWIERTKRQYNLVRRAPERNKAAMQARYDGVRALADAGVGLLVSSSGGWFLAPGFSMFVEMRCLSQAGLSNQEILTAATLHAARSVGQQDDWGSLAVGKIADMVLLDADPLVDIRHAERIISVVRRGEYFDREALDERLETASQSLERSH